MKRLSTIRKMRVGPIEKEGYKLQRDLELLSRRLARYMTKIGDLERDSHVLAAMTKHSKGTRPAGFTHKDLFGEPGETAPGRARDG